MNQAVEPITSLAAQRGWGDTAGSLLEARGHQQAGAAFSIPHPEAPLARRSHAGARRLKA